MQTLISANLPTLEHFAANGEFRLLDLRDAAQTDARGFPDSDYVPQAQAFMPCSWTARRADEREAGEVVRGLNFFDITGSVRSANNTPNAVETGKQIELRLKKGGSETKILEIVSVVSQANTTFRVWAIEAK